LGIRGGARSIPLPLILTSLAQLRLTGVLTVDSNPKGTLILSGGQLCSVYFGKLTGCRALKLILAEESASYAFDKSNEVLCPRTVSTEALLLDATRVLDEERRSLRELFKQAQSKWPDRAVAAVYATSLMDLWPGGERSRAESKLNWVLTPMVCSWELGESPFGSLKNMVIDAAGADLWVNYLFKGDAAIFTWRMHG